jgi:hypothetical protein
MLKYALALTCHRSTHAFEKFGQTKIADFDVIEN